ncbi:MAG TPA: hypothetical protein VFR49_15450, partial [Solirubrobacteraceae bacterium]|nr:hypothetical protein [Solirubrobacteraceae bacterium]
ARTPLIVAEADHLVAAQGGRSALRAVRADLAAGAYVVEWWPQRSTSGTSGRSDRWPAARPSSSSRAMAELPDR